MLVYSVLPGVQVIYRGMAIPNHAKNAISKLDTSPDSIIIRYCINEDFCFIHLAERDLPVEFSKYFCEVELCVSPSKIRMEDFAAFPEVAESIQTLLERFQLAHTFWVMKGASAVRQIFEELHQIPFPPKLFEFYMQIKVMELVLQVNLLHKYDTGVYLYKYTST